MRRFLSAPSSRKRCDAFRSCRPAFPRREHDPGVAHFWRPLNVCQSGQITAPQGITSVSKCEQQKQFDREHHKHFTHRHQCWRFCPDPYLRHKLGIWCELLYYCHLQALGQGSADCNCLSQRQRWWQSAEGERNRDWNVAPRSENRWRSRASSVDFVVSSMCSVKPRKAASEKGLRHLDNPRASTRTRSDLADFINGMHRSR